MSYIAEYHDSKHDTYQDIPIEWDASAEIADVIDDVREFVSEDYGDVISDVIYAYSRGPGCIFSLEDEAEKLYTSTKEHMSKDADGIFVLINKLDDESNIISTVEFPLSEILDDVIDRREGCEHGDCDVCCVIDKAIGTFSRLADWHFGLRDKSGRIIDKQHWSSYQASSTQKNGVEDDDKLEPLLWYGLSDAPVSPWTITALTSKNELGFWFKDDYDLMWSVIDDCTDSFLVWYFSECAYECFDMDYIRESCPIVLSKKDTAEDLHNKLLKFFSSTFGV